MHGDKDQQYSSKKENTRRGILTEMWLIKNGLFTLKKYPDRIQRHSKKHSSERRRKKRGALNGHTTTDYLS